MSYRAKIRLIGVRAQLAIALKALRAIAAGDFLQAEVVAQRALEAIEEEGMSEHDG